MLIKTYKHIETGWFVTNYRHMTDSLSWSHYTVYDGSDVLCRIFSRSKRYYNDLREIDYLIGKLAAGWWRKEDIVYLNINYFPETNEEDVVWIIDFEDNFGWSEQEKERKIWSNFVTIDKFDKDLELPYNVKEELKKYLGVKRKTYNAVDKWLEKKFPDVSISIESLRVSGFNVVKSKTNYSYKVFNKEK